jgi:hypothetical protein
MVQRAFKLTGKVNPDGKLEVPVPLPPGTEVEVLVLAPEEDNFDEFVRAAVSSTDFWDNPADDEDWNNA